jgi:2-keto-4-pentenoate hydratase/2-oxohepta-3-ene-1,7-dioic acid hydratase in catechol pathway
MKLATIVKGSSYLAGVVDSETRTVRTISHVGRRPVATMLEVIESVAAGETSFDYGATVSLDEVRLVAPIPRPHRNILCVGKNYYEHAREFARSGFDRGANPSEAVPEAPMRLRMRWTTKPSWPL